MWHKKTKMVSIEKDDGGGGLVIDNFMLVPPPSDGLSDVVDDAMTLHVQQHEIIP